MTQRKLRILIVDDETPALENHQKMVNQAIKNEAKAEFILAHDGYRCLQLLREQEANFHLIMLDILMPGKTGAEVIDDLQQHWLEKTVVITAREIDYSELFKKWVQKGVRDVWVKPIDPGMVRKTLEVMGLLPPKILTRRELDTIGLDFVKGESEALRRILTQVVEIAKTDLPVHITGESGVGKELIARSIYKLSKRSNGPFIDVNCAVIPPKEQAGLGAKIELFGCEKDRNLGYSEVYKGKCEEAHRGILFLDEIAQLEKKSQSMLLRVLDQKKINRFKGKIWIDADFRPISATEQDLLILINEGGFHSPLYSRLTKGGNIKVIPLRERKEDIPILAKYFLDQAAKEFSFVKPAKLTPGTLIKLEEYDWPFNVRELDGVINILSSLVGSGGQITVDNIHQELLKKSGKEKPSANSFITTENQIRERYFYLRKAKGSTIEDFYELFGYILNSIERTNIKIKDIDIPTIGSFLYPDSNNHRVWMNAEFQKIGTHFKLQGFGIKRLTEYYEKRKIDDYGQRHQK